MQLPTAEHWEGRGASQAAWGTSARVQGVTVGYGVQIPIYGNMGICITYMCLYVWERASCGPTSENSPRSHSAHRGSCCSQGWIVGG